MAVVVGHCYRVRLHSPVVEREFVAESLTVMKGVQVHQVCGLWMLGVELLSISKIVVLVSCRQTLVIIIMEIPIFP